MTTRPVEETGLRHSLVEDAFGLITGTFVASLGIFLLKSAHAVTGGTAGLSLLLSYATGISFGVLYFVTNLPFLVLAVLHLAAITAWTLLVLTARTAGEPSDQAPTSDAIGLASSTLPSTPG